MLMGAIMFSIGAFAQYHPANPEPICYVFQVFNCDENGELIFDPAHPNYQAHTTSIRIGWSELPSVFMKRVERAQEEYCRTGFVPLRCS